MATSAQLRKLHLNKVLNSKSKLQELDLDKVLVKITEELDSKYQVEFKHTKKWNLIDIVYHLNKSVSGVKFNCSSDTTFLRPDGGVLFMVDKKGKELPILISESKCQGTNNERVKEGLREQSRGNAIERLGKNVIGFRTAMTNEDIFPFVCFGCGCDFAPGSYIIDRVMTINMFGRMNKTYVHAEGENKQFKRGSMYFRNARWSSNEMYKIMMNICETAIKYYFDKYGKDTFIS